MKTKQKGKYDKTARQMKTAGLSGGIARRKGQWELERTPKDIPGKPKKNKGRKQVLTLTKDVKVKMAEDKLSGMTNKQIAVKYSTSDSYVQDCLQSVYLRSSKARAMLNDLLYNNAIAAGMRVRKTVDDLSPMQAAIVTGIMTQRAIDLEKHSAAATPDVDFSELQSMGELLKDLRGHAALPSDTEGDVIDIEGMKVE